jgi:hypothetical protein
MVATHTLADVPDKFLEPSMWSELRSFAVHRLEALTYLNAPFPRGADDFFWSAGRSSSDARRWQ